MMSYKFKLEIIWTFSVTVLWIVQWTHQPTSLQTLSHVISYLPFSGILFLDGIKYGRISFEQKPKCCLKQQS